MRKTKTDIVRDILLNQKYISKWQLECIGFKNIHSPISYLRKEGWELETVPGGYKLILTARSKKIHKELRDLFFGVLIGTAIVILFLSIF